MGEGLSLRCWTEWLISVCCFAVEMELKTGGAAEVCASSDAKRTKERQRGRKLANTRSQLEASLRANHQLFRYLVTKFGCI